MGRPDIVIAEPIVLPEHELLSRIFRTLGDATRLRVIEHLLENQTASQTELMEALGASQSRLSEHMSCLVWCGFVDVERLGRRVRYRLADRNAERFVGLARGFLRTNPQAVGGCTPLEGRPPRETVQVYGVL
jgi:DNA-binding transcriptional ArsR family regulator